MPLLPSIRAAPWALLLEAALVMRDHWHTLPEKDRARLADLVKRSRGRPANLTKRERDDLKRIVGQLDFKEMGKEMVPFIGRARGSRKRRR